MSKNPAWNEYNDKCREINEAYDKEAKPLRAKLSVEIGATEKKYNDQIQPLVLERDGLVSGIKAGFQERVRELEEKRKKALKTAHDVLQTEVHAFSEKRAAEKAAKKDAVPA
jgi:phage host-nuclease inhibitor protein Gam